MGIGSLGFRGVTVQFAAFCRHILGKITAEWPDMASNKCSPCKVPKTLGIVSYGKFRNDVVRLLGDTSAAIVATMIDFYGLPTDFPGRRTMPAGSCYDQVAYLEQEIGKDIGHPRLLPYLALHEFEAMLFVAPEKIAQTFPGTDKGDDLTAIRRQFNSPEEIDNSPHTAPSRRLKALFPGYEKPLHGPLVILEIGIEQIRGECAHFNGWLVKLEKLGTGV